MLYVLLKPEDHYPGGVAFSTPYLGLFNLDAARKRKYKACNTMFIVVNGSFPPLALPHQYPILNASGTSVSFDVYETEKQTWVICQFAEEV